ncbi:MAG: response regulator transcription factor [Planctomycetes bacterium]|nr:response regulator transcription factor [Planctomycetota bacterium]
MVETILIVEDDPAILLGLEKNLRYEGYQVLSETDGERGLEMAIDKSPDLILLDILLPRLNGYEILRTLRKHGVRTPVIALTAKDREDDKIRGLELGADDYITKPFSLRELRARVHAVLRRARRSEDRVAQATFGDVEVDFEALRCRRLDEDVSLTTREFRLLQFLVENQNRALPRKEILDRIWGYDYYGTSRTIDNFINRLRAKLEEDPNRPRHILTVRGIGYTFRGDDA